MENCKDSETTILKHDVPHHTGKYDSIGGNNNELAQVLWKRLRQACTNYQTRQSLRCSFNEVNFTSLLCTGEISKW